MQRACKRIDRREREREKGSGTGWLEEMATGDVTLTTAKRKSETPIYRGNS